METNRLTKTMQSKGNKSYAIAYFLTCLFSVLTVNPVLAQIDADLKIDELRFVLSPMVESKDLRSVYFLRVNREAAWSKVIRGTASRGNINVSLNGSGSSLNGSSLKLSFRNLGKGSVSASSCDGLDRCEKISVSGEGNLKTVSFEGSDVHVRLDGIPCKDSTECELLYTSIGASQLLSSASISDLPELLAVVETATDVLIVNPTSRKVLIRIDSTDVVKEGGLGRVQKAELSEKGILDIGFERGSIIIDFERDRLLAVTSSGVFISNEGLGDTYDLKFDSIYSLSRSDSSYVGYDLGYAVYSDGFIPLVTYLSSTASELNFVQFGHGIQVTESRVGTKDGTDRIYVKRKSGSIVRPAYFDVKSGTVKNLGNDDVSMHFIANGGFYSFSETTGTYFGAESVKSRTSFYKNSASVMLSRQGDGVLLKEEEKDSCTWMHYVRGSSSFNSFRETGISLPCSIKSSTSSASTKIKAWMSSNEKFSSVTSWDGSSAKVYVILKK